MADEIPARPVLEELTAATGGGIAAAADSWIGELQQPTDPTLRAIGGDYRAYRTLLRDDQVAACFQQRRRALTSAEWDVEPASERREDKKAAAALKENLQRLDWDRITDRMLYGIFYGFAVAECLWAIEGDRVVLADVRVRQASRFRWHKDGGLRLMAIGKPDGIAMPPAKFWVYAAGGEHDDDPYGRGVASYLYWPVFLKRNAAKFWAVALEKFGMPTAVGKYSPGDEKGKQAILESAAAVAREAAIAIPAGTELSLLEAAQRAGGDFSAFVKHWDGAIAKVILSQTMTTDDGSSLAQANVHMEVLNDVVAADADLICESFNHQVAAWLTRWNFPTATPPRVWRDTEEPDDLNTLAERDVRVASLGYRPTLDYITAHYGEGWEPAPATGGDTQAAPVGDAAAFAEAARTGTVDRIAAQLGEVTQPAIGALIERVRAEIDAAPDLQAAQERLLRLYPTIDLSELADAIRQALVISDLSGREEVKG